MEILNEVNWEHLYSLADTNLAYEYVLRTFIGLYNHVFPIKEITVCSYHVTHAFQSESALYSCLNVKELLARCRCEIWSLSDCNWTRTHNHLVWPVWLNGWVFVYELSGCGFESSCSHLKEITLKLQTVFNSWMTKGLQKLSKKKQKLCDNFFKSKINENEKKYKTTNLYWEFLRKSLKKLITQENLIAVSKI